MERDGFEVGEQAGEELVVDFFELLAREDGFAELFEMLRLPNVQPGDWRDSQRAFMSQATSFFVISGGESGVVVSVVIERLSLEVVVRENSVDTI